MKELICILFSVSLIISCSDDSEVNTNTFEYFEKHLQVDMKYSDLERVLGVPDDDIGSGIHIYVYHLEDGTQIVIGYTDYIHYAKHLDKDLNLLHDLL